MGFLLLIHIFCFFDKKVCAVLLARTSPGIMCDLASTLTDALADSMLSGKRKNIFLKIKPTH